MTKTLLTTSIKIMGKTYQIKCQEADLCLLQQAASYLDQKMCQTRDADNVIGIDRIAVITALNLAHQMVGLENKINRTQQRLIDLQDKVEEALSPHAQMELSPA